MSSTLKSVIELRDRGRREPGGDLAEDEFRSRLEALVAAAPAGIVRDHAFFSMPATTPPWLDTALDLRAGEHVTVFAVGRTYLSRELDIWLAPKFQLWYRVGAKGEIFRGARNSHTFTVEAGGRLFLAGYFPGEWATTTGELSVTPEVYRQADGGMCVGVVRWTADALTGLKHLAEHGDVNSFVSSEIQRLATSISPPPAWRYLAPAPLETYTHVARAGHRPAIGCYVHQDAVILRKDVSLPLAPDTRLRWEWKMDVLPSREREDVLHGHDYLSIAVEFDDGQDLTFFWSTELPVETGFRCPIPTWYARETHVVVRSGHARLGQWVSEERDLYADYERFIGPPPARIVRVWLIAVSLFRRREGQGEYGAIELLAGGRATLVN